jgi:hypothetical protein
MNTLAIIRFSVGKNFYSNANQMRTYLVIQLVHSLFDSSIQLHLHKIVHAFDRGEYRRDFTKFSHAEDYLIALLIIMIRPNY